MNDRQLRRTVALGVAIAAVGLLCLAGGIGLLAWRLLKPDQAVILPPGMDSEMTPTPGILGTPLEPPPVPDDPSQLAILPASERITPTPERVTAVTATVSKTPTDTQTPPPVTPTRQAVVSPVSTGTAAPTMVPSPTPTIAPPPAIPDHILIDAIGLDAPVVPVGQHPLRIGGTIYSQWDVPDVFAAGWHQNSAPLGQPGNTVINGHHNVNGEVFRYLILLKPGDIITLEARGKRYYYLVVQTMTLAEQDQPLDVRLANARWILPTDDERVTLITCWPYSASTHRLIVIALPAYKIAIPVEMP